MADFNAFEVNKDATLVRKEAQVNADAQFVIELKKPAEKINWDTGIAINPNAEMTEKPNFQLNLIHSPVMPEGNDLPYDGPLEPAVIPADKYGIGGSDLPFDGPLEPAVVYV